MNLYMLVTAGQGDIDIKLVDKETWDWVMKPDNTKIPSNVLAAYRERAEEGPEAFPSGQGTNDAALQVASAKVGHIRAEFSQIKTAAAFIRKHDITIVNEWHGYIY